jgi:hypothetical protein
MQEVDQGAFSNALQGLQAIVINPTPQRATPAMSASAESPSMMSPTPGMQQPMGGVSPIAQTPRKGKDQASINRGPDRLGGMGGDPRVQAMRGLASRVGGAY